MQRHLSFALLLLALLAPGCRSVAGPDGRSISGSIRYADGRISAGARVWIDGEAPSYSDLLGRYTLVVRSRAASLTVLAKEAARSGESAGSYTGRIQVTSSGKVTGRDIVLDTFEPI